MQYELKYKVIEPKRHTYQNIIDRFGDQPASRYQEATSTSNPARTSTTARPGTPNVNCTTSAIPLCG